MTHEYHIPGISVVENKMLMWETAHGDTVQVWNSAGIGEVMNWRWRVVAKNGEIISSGEGHTRRRKAREAALRHHPVYVNGKLVDDPAAEETEEDNSTRKPENGEPLMCFFDNQPCEKRR